MRVWRRLVPCFENITESGVSCLLTMVQGNLFAISFDHWMIASRTGLIAGSVTSAVVVASRTTKPWVVEVVLGALTAGADFFVHPGGFGPPGIEAIVTGIGATVLAHAVRVGLRHVRRSIAPEATPRASPSRT